MIAVDDAIVEAIRNQELFVIPDIVEGPGVTPGIAIPIGVAPGAAVIGRHVTAPDSAVTAARTLPPLQMDDGVPGLEDVTGDDNVLALADVGAGDDDDNHYYDVPKRCVRPLCWFV